MNNSEFLKILTDAFLKFLHTGSRSNEKLKILHGAIAKDLHERLDADYQIQSLGFGSGHESIIQGRYIEKAVDITVLHGQKPIAGIGVKFVMQNYSQNSNNYFENMLGETANIRSNHIPYFQIFIIPDKIPYYDRQGNFKKWEAFTDHNVAKYKILSHDNIHYAAHTPDKTLLYVIHLPDISDQPSDKSGYIRAYQDLEGTIVSESPICYGDFETTVIFNDYETFIRKVVYRILSL